MEMETETKNRKQPYGWWFDSHNTSIGSSPWLHSTLSELNEKTRKMLRMIEEDADTFTERVEMYYEKRPQLVNMVEDFYRAQRSLVEQIDHLRHHVCSRHCKISSLAISNKSCDVEDDSGNSDVDEDIFSDVFHEDEELGEEFAAMKVKHEEMVEEIDKLKEENKAKGNAIEELRERVVERENEVVERMQELEKFRVENVELKTRYEELRNELVMNETRCDEMKRVEEELGVVRAKNEEQCEVLKMKDEEKREVIRQLSVAIELLKDENVFLKKRLVIKGGRELEGRFQRLQRRLFNC